MVDNDGKNFYPTNAIWMTDGYGDYVRHYPRAMAAAPELAPENGDHLLRTSSVVKHISYTPAIISYNTFDNVSSEKFRLQSKPKKVTANGNEIKEISENDSEGWIWEALDKGGILKINHAKSGQIEIVR